MEEHNGYRSSIERSSFHEPDSWHWADWQTSTSPTIVMIGEVDITAVSDIGSRKSVGTLAKKK